MATPAAYLNLSNLHLTKGVATIVQKSGFSKHMLLNILNEYNAETVTTMINVYSFKYLVSLQCTTTEKLLRFSISDFSRDVIYKSQF